MTTNTQCTFQITGWNEKTYQEIEGGEKLSNAKVTQSYSGAIEGTSNIEYLMAYSVHDTATFAGLERVSGTVDGKTGTFVLQHTGSFSEGKARSTWSIVPGSGTGVQAPAPWRAFEAKEVMSRVMVNRLRFHLPTFLSQLPNLAFNT